MGKTVLYSPAGGSLGDVLSLQARAAAAAVEVSDCAVGRAWDEVRAELRQGDTLVVDSLSCFASLNELLGFVAISGVQVHSLAERWFSECPIVDPVAYQRQLYELGSSLHAARTRSGLDQAAQKGRKPGRKLGAVGKKSGNRTGFDTQVKQVDALRAEQRIPVVDACRRVGISVKTYYRKRIQ